jgi:hypothetical protein
MEDDALEVMCSEDLDEEEVQAFIEYVRSVFREQAG